MGFTYNMLTEMLKKAGNTFTQVTGQSISFIDIHGSYLLPLNYQFFSPFCKCVCQSRAGYEKCRVCNYTLENFAPGRVWLKSCHMGLLTINVLIQSQECGNVIMTCGQIILDTQKEEFFKNLRSKSEKLHLDYEALIADAEKLPVLSRDECMIRGQFLTLLSEYITICEEQIHDKERYQREYRKKLILENKLKSMEFQFLQSQISPHFLFNSLNLVARTAEAEGAEKTADLIYDLSDLLRWAFKSKESICTIADEIKCVQNYLNFQKVRLGENLHTEIQVDAALADCLIPVLTIQPLVENVILHGMQAGQPVKVYIDVKTDGKNVSLEITDTGKGMSDATLRGIVSHTEKGSGIRNVEERLRLYFGKDLHFSIESTLGTGTKIQIIWPRWKKETDSHVENSNR